jgi:hypothetical protein
MRLGDWGRGRDGLLFTEEVVSNDTEILTLILLPSLLIL